MAKKVESESYDIRSALPRSEILIKNAIRTQSEQLLILRKVRYLDGGDDNISILTEGSDLPDRSGPTSPEPIAADGGVSGYLDADVDNEAWEQTDGPDPADLVGSTAAPIHYKKDGFLAMANAGRYFLTFVPTRVIYQFHFMNSSNMPSAVPTLTFKMAMSLILHWCSKSCKNRFRGCHCAKSQCRTRRCEVAILFGPKHTKIEIILYDTQ